MIEHHFDLFRLELLADLAPEYATCCRFDFPLPRLWAGDLRGPCLHVSCLHTVPPRRSSSRTPSILSYACWSSLIGFIYLVAVCLDRSAIASDQPSCYLAAARAHVIVEVHVTAHSIHHCRDVPLTARCFSLSITKPHTRDIIYAPNC